MLEHALCALESGATVVTVNRRLARTLRHAYDLGQQQRRLEAWLTPDVLPWNVWLARLWESHDGEDVLSALQEQTLWEETVLETHPELVAPAAAARHTNEAWNLVHAWRIPLDHGNFADDLAIFLGWSTAYLVRCAGRLDAARLPGRLIQIARDIAPDNDIFLAGFDELDPRQRELAAALNCREVAISLNPPASSCIRFGCDDSQAEMTRAALWARALLQEKNERRIGIVVPKLHKERAAVAKIFDDVLCPARGLWAKEQRPYNISLAPALGRSPVIAAALGLLELTQDDPSLAKLACLLRSPFIAGSESEMAKRALLDAKLRDKGELICSWSLLARYAQEFAPILAQRLAALRQEFARIRGAATTGEWAKVFRNLLQAAGWPGDRALNSEEHQALARWDKLLNEFSTLDSCLPRLGFHDAVVRLRRVTDDVLFQPESPELPVQILGLLEARGQTFDHLWVAGMHDEVWPAPCSPNPFLPLALQRKFNLPHATPERELEHAKAALKGLLASADDVVLSWPRREGDVELHPSRLILEFPEASEIKLAQMTLYRDLIHNARQLEFFRDDRAPALAPGTFKRGSALFKNQAACPFKAFAEIRLRAQSLEELALGLSAADRGRLVHEVIGAIWDELKTYLALIAEPNLPGLVARAVAKVLAQAAKFRPHTFTTAFAALEERRLAALMLEWLELERARPPFGSISCEVKKTENIGSVTVNLRVDRIDRFANGEIALVDYKTGECDVAGWDDERPEEPQLPLYAYGVENLAALSFAQLRRGEVKFAGLAAREGIAPGIKAASDWQARITDWRRVLEELAQQFLSGAAQVDPKRFPHTCRNCDLPALCRIAERRADEHDD